MNTSLCSPLHVSSTTASDRRRSDQNQPQIDATRRAPAAGERALVLGGGGSTGNAWLIGVIAGLFDAGLDVTEANLRDKPRAPKGAAWDKAVREWRALATDPGAAYDRTVSLDAAKVAPQVTWGTSPGMVAAITDRVPDPASFATMDWPANFALLRKQSERCMLILM